MAIKNMKEAFIYALGMCDGDKSKDVIEVKLKEIDANFENYAITRVLDSELRSLYRCNGYCPKRIMSIDVDNMNVYHAAALLMSAYEMSVAESKKSD